MDAIGQTRQRLEQMLYPELERIAPHRRERAMERARAESFDTVELIGILAAVVATTYLTRYGVVATAAGRFWAAISNFLIALPLLILIAGPFYIRRNRRGLRSYLKFLERD